MMTLPNTIRIPLAWLKNVPILLWNSGSDMVRYFRYSQMASFHLNARQLEAKMTARAHVLEKGLSLSEPRPGFGQEVVWSVLGFLDQYEKNGYAKQSPVYQNTLSILRAYLSFSQEHDGCIDSVLDKELERRTSGASVEAGVKTFTRKQYAAEASGSFASVAQSRYSLRSFGSEPVDEQAVIRAMEVARKTPSVCNRQSWHLYWVRSAEQKEAVARLQQGNRGFGHLVDSFLVVTVDMNCFFGSEERNQGFIDGGLYAMSLIYALHAEGVGTCSLNWSKTVNVDRKLRHLLKIPKQKNIIMVIAIGSLPETFQVAVSTRKSVEESFELR